MLSVSTLQLLGESAKVSWSFTNSVRSIERVGLPEVAARIKLVVPNLARRNAFLKNKHYRFYTSPLKGAARTVKHCVQIAAFQKLLA